MELGRAPCQWQPEPKAPAAGAPVDRHSIGNTPGSVNFFRETPRGAEYNGVLIPVPDAQHFGAAGFEQAHAYGRVLGKPRCERTAGRAATCDDVIEIH